jgi:pyruvate dehydrogenase E2 component (dihydrolipoamide acetyltransferase)
VASQVILPKLTYEMLEGRILEWLCAEGDAVAAGQALFTVETDKAAVEVPADEAGALLKILVRAGETVPISTPVAWIGAAGETIAEVQGSGGAGEPSCPPVAFAEEVPASPAARRLARELSVDLREVQAFCGQKRVREADVQAFAVARKTGNGSGRSPWPDWPSGQPRPGRTRPGDGPTEPGEPGGTVGRLAPAAFELVHPTPLQRAMAARMTQAAAIPQMAAGCEVDLTRLEQFRNGLQADWERAHGFRLSYTHLIAALVARALESCPTLNASWTEEGIRLYRAVNLGVAMASERGLVVPVVRDANRRSLAAIAAEIVRLQHAAEQNRLPPEDLEGGTFTMTNVGMLGITLSIPLLNPPQSAILGIGAKRDQLKLEDGQLRVAPVFTIIAVADHRVVDGVAVAAFLKRVKELIEDPAPALGM